MCETFTTTVTTKQAGSLLGVSESTIKRWVNSGKLDASITPGGHRRVDVFHLKNFAETNGLNFKFDLPDQAKGESWDSMDEPSLKDELVKGLELGDPRHIESFAAYLKIRFKRLSELFDNIVYPAFLDIRRGCDHPSEKCLVLHRAVDLLQSAFKADNNFGRGVALKKLLQKPIFHFADVGYELDALPSFLAKRCIDPFSLTVNLGLNVPTPIIIGALKSATPCGLWLSGSGLASKTEKPKALTNKIQKIIQAANAVDCTVFTCGEINTLVEDQNVVKVSGFEEFYNIAKGVVIRSDQFHSPRLKVR